ncbi:MAG: hypothetical protein ISS53_01640 [Dehalococcoidia bacterium]|nr:hypothetical protein [Dehalococcoidia bacterium]
MHELEANKQIVFRHSSPKNEISKEANPNGSVGKVAGTIHNIGKAVL